ncbi:S-adenosyl-L-methionine-dependentmethyltransferases superfamily protein [Striga asiatica]|uniref:S-adenosyl-L-methionine-dependentmethyltransferases superfamily protein n=1 Tax=Striga asiatica TaxID=4170 RepID=A0A5A7Q550_STRAF|nr:S-adenosyl-L-methionine-dependentmethyltransferases superfamily protein [Striga asiatica]
MAPSRNFPCSDSPDDKDSTPNRSPIQESWVSANANQNGVGPEQIKSNEARGASSKQPGESLGNVGCQQLSKSFEHEAGGSGKEAMIIEETQTDKAVPESFGQRPVCKYNLRKKPAIGWRRRVPSKRNVISIPETYCTHHEKGSMKRSRALDRWHLEKPIGTRGGLLLLWDPNIEVLQILGNEFCCQVEVRGPNMSAGCWLIEGKELINGNFLKRVSRCRRLSPLGLAARARESAINGGRVKKKQRFDRQWNSGERTPTGVILVLYIAALRLSLKACGFGNEGSARIKTATQEPGWTAQRAVPNEYPIGSIRQQRSDMNRRALTVEVGHRRLKGKRFVRQRHVSNRR